MPFPWKKAKVSRISRFVADLHPPKPANSSLVVETGFPTSLVDLFVKNRDRLKKPIRKRKKRQQQQQQGAMVDEFVISDPIPLSNSRDLLVDPVYIENENQNMENLEHKSIALNNNNSSEGSVSIDRNLDSNNNNSKVVNGCVCGGDGDVDVNANMNKDEKCVLIAAVKMFAVVVLALSTKRLAVGITMSASILILLEYVGKHFFGFLKPCLCATMTFESYTQKVVLFFRRRWTPSSPKEVKKGSNLVEGDRDVGGDSCDLIESIGSNSSIEEIQPGEPRLDNVERLEGNKRVECETMRDLLKWDRRWGNLDMEEEEDEGRGLICEKEHGQRCKIRRKIIKKLVPKKLRAVKKGRKEKEKDLKEADLISEASSCCGDDKLLINEDREDRDNFEEPGQLRLWQLMEEETTEKRGNYSMEGKEEEKEKYRKEGNEEFEHRIATFNTKLHAKLEKNVVEESVDFEKGGNSGYVILFLVVLAGLVGGRILALLITVATCSLLKLVRTPSKIL